MNKEKLIRQLFVGKVSEVIGQEKTTELLKEAFAAFDEPFQSTQPTEKAVEFESVIRQRIDELNEAEVECDLGAKNMLLETELNALKETVESIAEQRDRLQNNLIDKEEVNDELRQTIIAKQQREIRLEDILAPHQELTQWIEEEMTCEPNSNKFEVSHDFLEALFYKVVQINH